MTRLPVKKTYKLYIGGAFPRSESGRTYEAEGQNVARASRKDVRDAVRVARSAFPTWAGLTAYNRGQVLYRLAEMMETRAADLAAVSSGRKEVEAAIDRVVWYAGWADKLPQVLGSSNPVAGPYFDFTVPEPTGVVAILAPSEPALGGLVSRIVPALVGGNTVVAVAAEGHPLVDTYEQLHGEQRRQIIPQFVTKHPTLNQLRDDPRVVGVVTSLLGDNHEYAESDGNLFDCESFWHSDTYGAPMRIHHVKLSFYLDPLRATSGAIRVIPGSQHFKETFATSLRNGFREPGQIADVFGVAARDIPSVALETDPGDLVVWDFRTIHGSYNGDVRRRLFSINYREKPSEPAA